MTTTIEINAQDTTQQVEGEKARAKFLRKVLREDGWIMNARESEDWQIVFSRKVEGELGCPSVEVKVKLEDKISLAGKWGNQRSFSDADEVFVPKPTWAHLSYSAVQTAARFLLEGSRLQIQSSAGSTASSKHGLSFASLTASIKGGYDTVVIGCDTVYVNGRSVCSGSVG